MNAAKRLMVVCGSLVCAALVFGSVAAKENSDKPSGRGHGRWKAEGRQVMHSEAMKAEAKRFREAMKVLGEGSKDLRKEIREALQAAKEGEEKLTQEKIEEIRKSYESKARKIATRIVDEQIRHRKKLLSIVKKERKATVDRLTERLLHTGKGGKGRKGKGEGKAKGESKEESKSE